MHKKKKKKKNSAEQSRKKRPTAEKRLSRTHCTDENDAAIGAWINECLCCIFQ